MILLARLPEGAALYWWSGRAAGVLRTRSAPCALLLLEQRFDDFGRSG
jgi:hypothetical protein